MSEWDKYSIIEVVESCWKQDSTGAFNLILAGQRHSNYTTVSSSLPPNFQGGFILENLLNTSVLTPKQLNSFFQKINKTPDGCWLWTGSLNNIGYGNATYKSKTILAHRLSYMLFKGEIPQGLVLDHFHCHVRRCVNPDHLEPVTQKENLLRGKTLNAKNMSRTHCPYGHPYDEENTKIRYLENGGTSRRCRACIKKESVKYHLQKYKKKVYVA